MRQLKTITAPPQSHWVGDGFPVRSLFAPGSDDTDMSPFLLLDYAEPAEFGPASKPRGVGEHPHRGFETVTIVYQGELEHRDSAGHGGSIGAGDVQWMTAGAGILHEELHSGSFTRNGGTLEMMQLWVNLPAKHKTAPPRYQTLTKANIPTVPLPSGAGEARVIAGTFAGQKGPAATFTPLRILDVRMSSGAIASFDVPDGWTALIAVRHGKIRTAAGVAPGQPAAGPAQVMRFSRHGGSIDVTAEEDAAFLLLTGEPINEPVVAQGPFVMNTVGEIKRAMLDYRSGKFGAIA